MKYNSSFKQKFQNNQHDFRTKAQNDSAVERVRKEQATLNFSVCLRQNRHRYSSWYKKYIVGRSDIIKAGQFKIAQIKASSIENKSRANRVMLHLWRNTDLIYITNSTR